MKNNEYKRYVRLGVAVTFLAMLCMVPLGHTMAQSYTTSSSHDFLFGEPTDSTIVRNWNDTVVITCCRYSNNYTISHVFHMRYATSPTTKMVKIPVWHNVYGEMGDRINDVRIVDSLCYFCGTRVKKTGQYIEYDEEGHAYLESIYDTCGIMGYFTFNSSLDVTGGLYLFELIKVKSARRMAVYRPIPSVLTGMLVVCGYGPSENGTCLVELSNSLASPNQWNYNVLVPSDENEILTDVAVTNSYLVTTSVFENDRHIIGFRGTKNSWVNVFTEMTSDTQERYKYNIGSHNPDGCDSYGFLRRKYTPALLCPKGDGFMAGVSAVPDQESLPGWYVPSWNSSVLLFDMDDVSSMNEYQVVSAGMRPRLKELTYLSMMDAVGILYRAQRDVIPDSEYTVLQFPLLNKVQVCESYTDTLLRKNGGEFQSIDTYRSHSVSISGIKWQEGVPYDGVQRQYNRSNSCFVMYGENKIARRPVLSYMNDISPFDTPYTGEPAYCVHSNTVVPVENMTMHCSH